MSPLSVAAVALPSQGPFVFSLFQSKDNSNSD